MTSKTVKSTKPARDPVRYGRVVAWSLLGLAVIGLGWLLLASWQAARWWNEAQSAARAGRWDQVELALSHRGCWRGQDGEVLKLRSFAALRRGDRAEAARWLGAIPAASPLAASARATQGRLLLELFRAREAETALREAARLEPGLMEARRLLVAIMGLQQRRIDFERDLGEMLDAAEVTRDPALILEVLRLMTPGVPVIPFDTISKTTDEGWILRQCLARDPSDPSLRPPLARFHRLRGENAAAHAVLDPWLLEHPDDLEARVEWIALALDEGEDDDVRPVMEPAPTWGVNSGSYSVLRALWLQRRGRQDEAIQALEIARKLIPRDPEPSYRLSQLRREPRDLEQVQAYQRLQKVVAGLTDDARPDSAIVEEAARLCRVLGREREAKAWEGVVRRLGKTKDELVVGPSS